MKSAQPQPFVFVLMPFRDSFKDIYYLGIKAACEAAGAYCERVDEAIFHDSILQRIYVQISKADYIISDMTGKSPNVFYETGYAHALGKIVILLTQDAKDIPFDLQHYPHIIYGKSIINLKQSLEERIKWYIENSSSESSKQILFDLEFYTLGKDLEKTEYPEIIAKRENSLDPKELFYFDVDIKNASSMAIDLSHYEFGLILPNTFTPHVSVPWSHVDEDHIMISTVISGEFLPGAWRRLVPHFETKLDSSVIKIDCKLKILSKIGQREIPFILRLDKST